MSLKGRSSKYRDDYTLPARWLFPTEVVKHDVGTCDICQETIQDGESWHCNGYRLAHMRCEWREP